MDKNYQKLESEEYKGAGKLGNAWAKFTALWLPASIIGGITTGAGMLFARDSKSSLKVLGLGGITFLGTLGFGAVWGWRQSGKAQEQHEALKGAVKDLRIENEMLKSEKKWADRVAEKQEQQAQTMNR